jgi:hypothetical protein
LGSSEFIEELLAEAEEREGIDSTELRSGGKSRLLVRAQKIFSQLAVKRMGCSGAEVARYLGVTTSAINRIANSEELPVIEKYSKLL